MGLRSQRPLTAGISDQRQQPSQRKKSEAQKQFENVKPVTLKGNDISDATDYAKFKTTFGQ